MYFKNDFGKVYIENEKLYVDTEICSITIEPKGHTPQSFLTEEYEHQITILKMAQDVLPPKN